MGGKPCTYECLDPGQKLREKTISIGVSCRWLYLGGKKRADLQAGMKGNKLHTQKILHSGKRKLLPNSKQKKTYFKKLLNHKEQVKLSIGASIRLRAWTSYPL